MRKFKCCIYAAMAALFVLFISGCTKNDENGDNDDSEDIVGVPVVITGDINSSSTQATKVLAISSTDSYKVVDITNNHFSIELDNGKPWGIVFLNNSEQPLGVLSFGNGIKSLPLQGVFADTINLQTINCSENEFIPTHNPIGNEIVLTTEQQENVAVEDDYLSVLLENPDVNNNGKIDVLEEKLFKLEVVYFIRPGDFFGSNLTPTRYETKLISGYKLFLTVRDKKFPSTVYFTGPAGSPLHNSSSEGNMDFGSHHVYSTTFLEDIESIESCIPVGGVYTIDYNGTMLTFDLPDQEYVKSNVVFPWPTLTLNGNGTMNKFDWVYLAPEGGEVNDLNALVRSLQIQIEGKGNICGGGTTDGEDRLYDSPNLSVTTTSHTLSCQNIDWGWMPTPGSKFVRRLALSYEDHYDNSYVVMYERTFCNVEP